MQKPESYERASRRRDRVFAMTTMTTFYVVESVSVDVYHGIDCDFGFHVDGYFSGGCFFPWSDFGFDCVYFFVLMKLAVAAGLEAFPVAFP